MSISDHVLYAARGGGPWPNRGAERRPASVTGGEEHAQGAPTRRREPEATAAATLHRANNRPWEEIIKVATEEGCDLISMASHGRSGVSALLLGSETTKVLTHSKIPVLVYR